MIKAFAFYAFLFVGFTMLSLITEGGGGLLGTNLTASLNSTATSMTVTSTAGYLTSDKLVVEREEIFYTGKTPTTFTGLVRGYNNTEAKAHANGLSVYTKPASVVNNLAGFNIGETAGTVGTLQLLTFAPGALKSAFSQLVLGDYSFMRGSMIYLRYFYSAFSIGLGIFFIITMLSAFGGLVRR